MTEPSWREFLRTEEVSDAQAHVGTLFRRCFGHAAPSYPRHFVLFYYPDGRNAGREAVAYAHHLAFNEVYLGGGMCADERAYRRFPKWLFTHVREAGGLATIVSRDSFEMLGDAVAVFGYVGEPRARQADLRSGFVDAGEKLMVYWRRRVPESEQRRLIEMVAARGAF